MPEEIYLGRFQKSFCHVRWENQTDRSIKSYNASKNKSWREKVRDQKFLKVLGTKTDPKSEENDNTRLVFSGLTFVVTAAPTTEQACLESAATGTAIPEDPTRKDFFAAADAWMQVLSTTAPRSMDTITVESTKYQLAMLAKKGASIVDQGGNSYLMNAMTFSTIAPCDSGLYKNKLNGEFKPLYLLNDLTSGKNETEPNRENCPSSIFLASPMSSGDHNGNIYNTDDSYKIKEVTSSSHEYAKIHEDPRLVDKLNWFGGPSANNQRGHVLDTRRKPY